MAKSACIDTYEKFLIDKGVRTEKLSIDERKALQQEHEQMMQRAETEGVDLQSTEGDGTVGDRMVDDNYNQITAQKFEDKISNIASLQKNQHFVRDFKANVKALVENGEDETDAIFKVLEGMIIDTGETYGGSPLLEIFKSRQIEFIGELNALTRKHFDINWEKFFKANNDVNRKAFIRELINIEKTKNTKGASVTDTPPALEVARGYYKFKIRQASNRILTGNDESLSNVNQRVVWDRDKVRKISREDFIQKHIDDLDEAVHGTDYANKQRVLGEAYDNITQNKPDWRVIGDKVQAGQNKSLRKKSATLTFKDGETFLRMHEDYSRVGIEQQIITDLKEFARQDALHSFFGSNLNPIRSFIEKQGRKINKARMNAAIRHMDALIDPHTYEYNNTYTRWQNAKLLQVSSKLGTAFITALIDIPNAILAGKNIFSMSLGDRMKFLTAGVKMSASEERLYAEEIGFIFDDMIGRFADDVTSASTFGGAVTKKIQDVAQLTMKASYLQQWTNNLRGAVVGIYSRQIGRYLKKGTQFKDLPKGMREALAKYGIDDVSRGGQPVWTRLLENDVLDERGFLDMRKIGELERVFETAFGKTSMRTNITSLFNDVSKTLIIEGNDWDKSAARFFADDRTWAGAVYSTINQFKQIPIGIWRRVIYRQGKLADSKVEAIMTAAYYATTMTMMGAVVNTTKDYLKGREPERLDSVNTWTRAAVTGGGLGVVSDVIFQLGGEDFINAVFKGEKMRRSPFDAVQLLGPVLSDGIKIGEGLLKFAASGDDEAYERRQLSNLTSVGLGLLPLQNLWWAQMLIRKYIGEFTLEYVDPRGYRERERRLNNRAREERLNGAYNNFIFTDILP